MALLNQAHKALIAATRGEGLNRTAVLEWHELKAQAQGDEAELIGEGAEALMVAAGPGDERWLRALLSGGPEAAERAALQDRMQDEAFTFTDGRGDAADGEEEQQPDQGGGLDWGLIGKEVEAMIRLNPQERSESVTEAGTDPQE